MDVTIIKKLQCVALEILKETDRICREQNLRYYLIGGTLLGAVRHGGFIPWDLDIDIAMPREDYEKFRKYWEKETSGKYFYQHHTTEKNHTETHAVLKLTGTEVRYKTHRNDKYHVQCDGVYMDIFPLDFASSDEKKQRKQAKQIRFLSAMIQAKICRDYHGGKTTFVLKKILSVVLKPFSFVFFQKQIEKIMQRHNNEEREYLVSMASHYSYRKQLMKTSIYGEPKKIQFENLEFYAPQETEAYLKQLYGDYMKLPPEETRYRLLDLLDYVDLGEYEAIHHD